MKILVVISIIAICGKTGFALPTKPNDRLRSSGVVCVADDEGNLVECDEENSVLPDDLNVDGWDQQDAYICLDVTYNTGYIWKTTHHVEQCAKRLVHERLCDALSSENEITKCIESEPEPKPDPQPEPESQLYCIIDDFDNTVECDRQNSVLPDDLDDGSAKKSDKYICLDIFYKTGIIGFRTTHHVQQCALELSGDDNLCNVLEGKNSVDACLETTPYNSPTVEPLSNLFCPLDDGGDLIQCNNGNSKLPSDLLIGDATESGEFVCLKVTYKTGWWPFQTSHEAQQCAHQTFGEDLCQVLRDENSVDACLDWTPGSPTTTAAPTTATPTTAAPTTAAPTTAAPTTAAPTTAAPTTAAPTTAAPTTAAPTTAAPTTAAPTTAAPTTAAPTTTAPTTSAPTTAAPTTAVPTTSAPTTVAPTTAAPTTAAPTTSAPTTAAPTTVAPTTAAPTTVLPTTAEPTTAAPTTAAPTTAAPTTAAPTTAAPTTVAPTTAAPTSAAPTTAAPTRETPTSAAPTSAAPTTAAPTDEPPTTAAPTTEAETTAAPTTAAPVNL